MAVAVAGAETEVAAAVAAAAAATVECPRSRRRGRSSSMAVCEVGFFLCEENEKITINQNKTNEEKKQKYKNNKNNKRQVSRTLHITSFHVWSTNRSHKSALKKRIEFCLSPKTQRIVCIWTLFWTAI